MTSAASTCMLDVIVTRGALVESRHRVHAAVVDHTGRVVLSARAPETRTWWRSCAKPFQVLPTIDAGCFDARGWSVEMLALACASHGGEPEHVELAGQMLRDLGLDASALACGPHEPLASRGAKLLRAASERPTRLHNNCSGKHAAMLARAVHEGWPIDRYFDLEHPVQVASRASVSHWTGVPSDDVAQAVDGCGVPVFGLPLTAMAWSYARLVEAARQGVPGPARVVQAMLAHPFLVGGTDRFDTLLMQAAGGSILCKIGAEGVHTLALVREGIGIALKVEDGAPRAQYAAVLAVLSALGAVPASLPEALIALSGAAVRNTRGDMVGEIRVDAAALGERPSNA